MTSTWDVPSVGWVIVVMGWFLSPLITLLLPKILSYLVFDPSEKLRQLKIHILPELEDTLAAVDQKRMLDRGEKKAAVSMLDDMAAMLRHAREDAQDIFDDAQHKIVTRCCHRLYGAAATCIARCVGIFSRELVNDALQWPGKILSGCWHGLRGAVESICTMWNASIARSGLARLLHWAPNRFQEPVHSTAASHAHVGVTIQIGDSHIEQAVSEATPSDSASHEEEAVSEAIPSDSASQEEEAVSEATPSDSASQEEEAVAEATPSGSASHEQALVPVITPSCSSFHIFKNSCRSILYWIVDKYEKACVCRDEVVGITGYQENASVLDSFLTAISRRNLKKRIEKVERTVSEVKKSPLFVVASKSASEDIANKNRSRIRTATNRKVFGREALRDSIMEKLRKTPPGDVSSSSTSPCYSVIGIYGVAGSGKTTFARYTRDYIKKECKEEKLFDTVMCIHVSETFSVKDIFHEMLKDITKDRHSNISNLEELKKKLKESLRGKCFFLILDDLWVKNKNDPQLEELISPLSVGLKGSKILVTARTKVAAGALCADEPIKIPELDDDQYLSMFMHYALGGTSVADEEYKRVGKVMAKKLHGSPIAAVIVAGQLGANRDISFWENTAKLDMLNGTMDALWWSYQQLSPDIKRCFEYCNMFPRRFKMKKSDLVHLWIAQGYVKTSCAREDMEDVAEGYIQELVSCSFLQPERTRNDVECFGIHDLLHELADMVTRTDSFRIENKSNQRGESWKGDIPRDVRHIFIQNYDAELISEEIFGFRHLRTLIINDFEGDTQVEEKMMENICMKLPKMRVLAFYLSNESIKKRNKFSFPESIGQLKYLRYLAFRANIGCKITLPSTINKFHHIQVLDFGYGEIAEFTFAELVNLRHIFCWRHKKLPYVGRLSSLQTLPGFKVSIEQGCELKELRDLNKLQGELCISGLKNVKSKAQALQANLTAKERLTELSLWWVNGRCSREVEADVLEGLCPPVGLQKLALWYFAGCRYPDWMVGKHSGGPKDLQELILWECSQPIPASELAKAFPYLRMLKLWYCIWDALPGNMEHLTSLKELNIRHCNNIRLLPSLPESLEKFILWCCNAEFTESCKTVGHPNWQKIEHIPNKIFVRSSTIAAKDVSNQSLDASARELLLRMLGFLPIWLSCGRTASWVGQMQWEQRSRHLSLHL